MKPFDLIVAGAVVVVAACSGEDLTPDDGDAGTHAGEAGEGGGATTGGAGGANSGSGGTRPSGGSPAGGAAGAPRGGTSQGGDAGESGAPTGGASDGGAAGDGGAGGTCPPQTAGTMAGPAGGGTSGSNAGTAGGGAGSGGAPGCNPNPPPQLCSGAPVNMHMPTDGVVIDFATYNSSSGAWGNASNGDLTGGSTKYGGSMVPLLTLGVTNGRLHITGTVPPYTPDIADDAENFAGITFWFGPCVNASAFNGLELTIGGSMGIAALKLQVQTNADYPADPANSRGGCVFADCETRWFECKGPEAEVTVPATPSLREMPWCSFTGGLPMPGVTPDGLVGLKFEFQCQTMVACPIDVTVGTISFATF